MAELVPSEEWAHGGSVVEATVAGARSLSIAVAFVTDSGADWLIERVKPLGGMKVELVARAGGVTSPAALRKIRDELEAEVSVVIGSYAMKFHPKLWLARTEHQLVVLAGSGNLTLGGMEGNFEQFELIKVPIDGEEASAHEERFLELTGSARSLKSAEGSVAWSVWEQTILKMRNHRKEIRRLERSLAETPFVEPPTVEREELIADLFALHAGMVAKDMLTPKGRLYRPNRFLAGIRHAQEGGDPFELVSRLCSRQTGGFDIILAYDYPYLTVESLVIDPDKKYHRLFTDKTRELAVERLRQFPSWPI